MKMNYITQFGNGADLGIWINPICMVSFGLGICFYFYFLGSRVANLGNFIGIEAFELILSHPSEAKLG